MFAKVLVQNLLLMVMINKMILVEQIEEFWCLTFSFMVLGAYIVHIGRMYGDEDAPGTTPPLIPPNPIPLQSPIYLVKFSHY